MRVARPKPLLAVLVGLELSGYFAVGGAGAFVEAPAEYEALLVRLPDQAGTLSTPRRSERFSRLAAARRHWADFSPDGLAAPPCAAQLAPVKR